MAKFEIKNMSYIYRWTTYNNDDPKVTGKPDSTLLNRNEGYEILSFINNYADRNNLSTSDCKEIEELIKTKVPKDIHSREKISNWLDKNF